MMLSKCHSETAGLHREFIKIPRGAVKNLYNLSAARLYLILALTHGVWLPDAIKDNHV